VQKTGSVGLGLPLADCSHTRELLAAAAHTNTLTERHLFIARNLRANVITFMYYGSLGRACDRVQHGLRELPALFAAPDALFSGGQVQRRQHHCTSAIFSHISRTRRREKGC
jgi:hypothetical protein